MHKLTDYRLCMLPCRPLRLKPHPGCFRGHRFRVVIRKTFLESCPFCLSLEEAKVTTRTTPPLVIFRDTNPALFQNPIHVIESNPVFAKREHRCNVWLGRDITFAILVSTNSYVADYAIGSYELLEWLDLPLAGTPPHP